MGSGKIIAYRLIVSGSVQGVGFRAFAVSSARRLGVNGTVRNLEDGNVEVVAEGDPERLKLLIERLKEGNGWSRTDRVEMTQTQPQGITGFDDMF
jgi:acylphosphatase